MLTRQSRQGTLTRWTTGISQWLSSAVSLATQTGLISGHLSLPGQRLPPFSGMPPQSAPGLWWPVFFCFPSNSWPNFHLEWWLSTLLPFCDHLGRFKNSWGPGFTAEKLNKDLWTWDSKTSAFLPLRPPPQEVIPTCSKVSKPLTSNTAVTGSFLEMHNLGLVPDLQIQILQFNKMLEWFVFERHWFRTILN